jgi:hypothetical protein
MRKLGRLTGIVAAALALAAIIGATGAQAKMSKLTLDQGEAHMPLAAGSPFTAIQDEFNGSKFVVVYYPGGAVECRNERDHNALTGAVVTNGKGTDTISFAEGGFEFGECNAEPVGFPFTLKLHKNGELTTKPFGTVLTLGSDSCTYTAKTLHGNAPVPSEAETPLELSFFQQLLKLDRTHSSATCPTKAAISMEWDARSEGNQVYERL